MKREPKHSNERLRELAARLVAPGPKAAAVSASECHEIAEGIAELIDDANRRFLLLDVVGPDVVVCSRASEDRPWIQEMRTPIGLLVEMVAAKAGRP